MNALPAIVYWGAFLGAFMVAGGSLPGWRRWCRASGLVDEPGHRKIHQAPIPLAGGLAVITGLAVTVLAGWLALKLGWLEGEASNKLSHGLSKRAPQLLALGGGAIGMLAIGWLDDHHDLKPGWKFAGQLAVALGTALAGARITLFVDNYWFSVAATTLWILTVTNAFNLCDNMNGLCAGLGALGAAGFAAHSLAHGYYLVALLALAVTGSLLGFLPYNYPKATVFLGDSGSHLVGYLMASLAILPHFYAATHPKPWAVLSPLLLLAVPLLDMAWVVLLRTWHKRPFYVGDNNHFSHLLVRAGLSQRAAVAWLWVAAAVLGALAMKLW
jgi:UDP-GlcNAc:undecaprenyl-phosphate GlcNAc-1-phosphate transferase